MSHPDPPDPPANDDRAAELQLLRAQLAVMEQRALEAEAIAEELAEQLADARARLAQPSPSSEPDPPQAFFGSATTSTDRPATDRSVVPLALGALAVVAVLLAVVAFALQGWSPAAVAALVVAAALAVAAYRTRSVPTSVTVEHGVVTITRRTETRRFDLASDRVRLDVHGRPGDPDWRIRFYRRSLEPVDVDATMVEPLAFLEQLREHRPDL